MLFGMPLEAVWGQILIGLINGSSYAMLSLGLTVIFGLLRVVNFAHGALYMLGAFSAYWLSSSFGIGFWSLLILAPVMVAVFSFALERLLLRYVYGLDHLYGLLLTFGFALVIEGAIRYWFGAAGRPFAAPKELAGIWDLGFVIVPRYRGFVVLASIAVCFSVWVLIEKTKMGSYLRAGTENPGLVQVFGINLPLLLTLTYMLGAGLAALAGVLTAPIYQISPFMGSQMIIVAFAVVVAGGMGSIGGSVLTGYLVGIVEALTTLYYSPASSVIIFVLMAVVLLVRPAGLFGREES